MLVVPAKSRGELLATPRLEKFTARIPKAHLIVVSSAGDWPQGL